MKYYFLVIILAAVAVAGMGCEQVKSAQEEQTNPEPAARKDPVTAPEVVTDDEPLLLDDEPLLLDDEPLLLLDDGPDEDSSTESMADNSRCFVCHINYMEEDIAVTHARANIGCADCHGNCDEHIADESWASGGNGTAPDIMYPREKINPFCTGCHTGEKIDKEKYCTDCHGDHRLTNRKCKWK